jgi:hypothetical protein
MHEEMHDDASEEQQREKPVASKNVDTVFEREQEPTDPESNQKIDARAGFPEPLFAIVLMIVLILMLLCHLVRSYSG